MLCDVYILKIVRFGTLSLCAATFCNITSCDVYIMLLYITIDVKMEYYICVFEERKINFLSSLLVKNAKMQKCTPHLLR